MTRHRDRYDWMTSYAFRAWAVKIYPFCQWCGCTFDRRAGRQVTTDHIVPRSKGGSDELDNLCLACAPCNHQRRNQPAPGVPQGPNWREEWDRRHGIIRKKKAPLACGPQLPAYGNHQLVGKLSDGRWRVIFRGGYRNCEKAANTLRNKTKNTLFVEYTIEPAEPVGVAR